MSETLKSLMGKITKTRKETNIKLEEIPSATRGAWTVRVNNAKASLEGLETQYRQLVLETALAVPTTGPQGKVEAWGALVEKQGEGFLVDAQALYKAIAEEIEPIFGATRQWGMDQTLRLRQAIPKVLDGMGISSIMTPDTGRPAHCPDVAATQKYIRDVIRASNGDDLNVLYLKHVIGNKALEMKYAANTAPVFLTNVLPDDTQSLKGVFGDRPVVTLKLKEGDDVTEEFMLKTFESLVKKTKTAK
jgi:hypothetical protein